MPKDPYKKLGQEIDRRLGNIERRAEGVGKQFDQGRRNLERGIDRIGKEADRKIRYTEGRVDSVGENFNRKLSGLEGRFPSPKVSPPPASRTSEPPLASEGNGPLDASELDENPFWAAEARYSSSGYPLSTNSRSPRKTWESMNRRPSFVGDPTHWNDGSTILKRARNVALLGGALSIVGWYLTAAPGFFQFGVFLLALGTVGALWSARLTKPSTVPSSAAGESSGPSDAGAQPTPRSEPSPTIIVQREVVKIPCKCCGKLTDATKTCERCGGRPL